MARIDAHTVRDAARESYGVGATEHVGDEAVGHTPARGGTPERRSCIAAASIPRVMPQGEVGTYRPCRPHNRRFPLGPGVWPAPVRRSPDRGRVSGPGRRARRPGLGAPHQAAPSPAQEYASSPSSVPAYGQHPREPNGTGAPPRRRRESASLLRRSRFSRPDRAGVPTRRSRWRGRQLGRKLRGLGRLALSLPKWRAADGQRSRSFCEAIHIGKGSAIITQ